MPDTLNAARVSIETIEKEVEQLPLLPSVLFEIMKYDPENVDFYDRMLEIARSDPPLATMILSYANSASSSPAHPIIELKIALTRVGAQSIKNLLTTLSVAKVFVPAKLEHKMIWLHSIEVAHIAAFICETSRGTELKSENVYMAGLLHDIGRFVLFQLAPTALNETDAKGWENPTELVSVEEKILGFNHAKVGYMACQKLNLPPIIRSLVRYHHYLNVINNSKAPAHFKRMCVYVQLADFVSVFLIKHPEWRDWDVVTLRRQLKKTCVLRRWDSMQLPIDKLADALPDLYKDSKAVFSGLGL